MNLLGVLAVLLILGALIALFLWLLADAVGDFREVRPDDVDELAKRRRDRMRAETRDT